jgi:hypothetical protein
VQQGGGRGVAGEHVQQGGRRGWGAGPGCVTRGKRSLEEWVGGSE